MISVIVVAKEFIFNIDMKNKQNKIKTSQSVLFCEYRQEELLVKNV